MKKSIHEMVQRTRGRDNARTGHLREYLYFENLSVLLGVEMVVVCDDRAHYARCAVLFGRKKCEAANDAVFEMRRVG